MSRTAVLRKDPSRWSLHEAEELLELMNEQIAYHRETLVQLEPIRDEAIRVIEKRKQRPSLVAINGGAA